MEKEKYFLIDICGTLYQSNTTFDFIRYFFSETSWYIRLEALRKNRIFRFCNAKVFEYMGIDCLRCLLIRHLKGYSKTQLQDMAHEFYQEYLETVINEPVIDIIEEKRAAGVRLVLVSATLDVIAKEVAEKLRIKDVFSSQLSYDEHNVCLGKLQIDLLGKKITSLNSSDIVEPYYGIITDNFSDLELIKKSEHSYVVTDKQYQNKWKSLLKNNIYNYSFVAV